MLIREEIMGKLVADPEINQTCFGVDVCSFRVACDNSCISDKLQTRAVIAECFVAHSVARFIARNFTAGMPILPPKSASVRKITRQRRETLFLMDIDAKLASFIGKKMALSEEQLEKIPALIFERAADCEDDSIIGAGEVHFTTHPYDRSQKNIGVIVEPILAFDVEYGEIVGVHAAAIVEPWDNQRDDWPDFSWSDVDIQTAIDYLQILTGEVTLIEKSSEEETADDLISISELARRIAKAELADQEIKLEYKDIADWLFDNGYLVYTWNQGKKTVRPSKAGEKKGLYALPRNSPSGERYIGLLLDEAAQNFVKTNLDAIIRRKQKNDSKKETAGVKEAVKSFQPKTKSKKLPFPKKKYSEEELERMAEELLKEANVSTSDTDDENEDEGIPCEVDIGDWPYEDSFTIDELGRYTGTDSFKDIWDSDEGELLF